MRLTATAWVALGLATSLHLAAALAMTRVSTPESAPPPRPPAEPAAVQVRRIVLPDAVAPGPAPAKGGIRAGALEIPAGLRSEDPAARAARRGATQPSVLADTLPAEPTPSDAEAEAPLPVQAEDGYVPRAALSSAPVAQGPVLLVFPDAPDLPAHVVAVVSLFIDETGGVQRIRIEGAGLPEALETAVRQAFAPVRFSPGEVDGRPVPSLVRVEVRFDVDELAATPMTP